MNKKGTTRPAEDFLLALGTNTATPPPLPQAQIDELKPGFWQSLLNHRRSIKMRKVETKTALNYNHALLGVIAIIGIAILIVGAAVIVALHTLQAAAYRVSDDAATIISDHPAIALAAYGASQGHNDDTITIAAILSEISAKGNIQGSFKGHWATTTENTLVKIDPACIEKYTYRKVSYGINDSEFELQTQQAIDAGYEVAYARKEVLKCVNSTCEPVDEGVWTGYAIYRRNEHACAYKIVPQERPGEFIPETIAVNNVDLGYQGIGKRAVS